MFGHQARCGGIPGVFNRETLCHSNRPSFVEVAQSTKGEQQSTDTMESRFTTFLLCSRASGWNCQRQCRYLVPVGNREGGYIGCRRGREECGSLTICIHYQYLCPQNYYVRRGREECGSLCIIIIYHYNYSMSKGLLCHRTLDYLVSMSCPHAIETRSVAIYF